MSGGAFAKLSRAVSGAFSKAKDSAGTAFTGTRDAIGTVASGSGTWVKANPGKSTFLAGSAMVGTGIAVSGNAEKERYKAAYHNTVNQAEMAMMEARMAQGQTQQAGGFAAKIAAERAAASEAVKS
jgi:hypothetical protein